jgi:hypothetical protein
MRTMISLLIDDNIQNFDVIAIQKLWRNFFVSITLSFNQSDFHLLYRLDENTRICFYVNNKLNTNNWDVEYSTIDICTLKMKINELMKIWARYIFTMCTIFRSSSTRHETVRSHSRRRKNHSSMRSRIITFCLKISIFIIFFEVTRRDRRSTQQRMSF